jgi:16S rRNA G966 N2-methylase RsmD
MLDLFSGTGAHGIEIISRGCCDVTAVDKFPPAVNFLRAISIEWGFEDCIQLIRKDAGIFMRDFKGMPFDYIFAGPPYPLPWLDDIPNRLYRSGIPHRDSIFVLEHNPNHDFADHAHFTEVRAYGDTRFSFFAT